MWGGHVGVKPITIPKEKMWGDMAYYIPTVWKSGGTRPPPTCAHAESELVWRVCAAVWAFEPFDLSLRSDGLYFLHRNASDVMCRCCNWFST